MSPNQRDRAISTSSTSRISRRRFLELAGAAAAGLLISSCTPEPSAAPVESVPTSGPTAAAPAVADATQVASTPAATTEAAVAQSAPTGLSSQVAIATAQDYDRTRIYNAIRDMLDNLGGFGDVVRPGDRVAIKTNLTGGLGNNAPAGLTPMQSFVTHPEVVRALGALVLDAGAAEVFIVEAVYQWGSYTQWGYEEAAKDIGATLIDLNSPDPYDEFVDVPVPGGGRFYDAFSLNPLLQEVDAFMSVSKMKCHWVAGVTHTMKNLFGIAPLQVYRSGSRDTYRSGFHGPSDETAGQRVPEIIVDLNKTRPVNFSLIDGVMTSQGGEGPWIQTFTSIAPGVLFAGKDPVATDSVATVAMGFDPTAAPMTVPFVRGKNHIAIAAAAGLGTNRLDEIEIVGSSLDEVTRAFNPCVVGL